MEVNEVMNEGSNGISDQKESPLKRSRFMPFFIHSLCVATYFYGLYGYFDITYKYSTGAPEEYAGFFKYLTFWNLIFHFLYFCFSLAIDVDFFIWKDHLHTILKIRDFAFAAIVFPYGVFVSLMFWVIFITDRNQIFPEEAEPRFPAWLNHISHSVILAAVIAEICIVYHRYPRRRHGYALTLALGAAYLTWVLILGIAKDIWVYIFLKDFTYFGRTVFFLVSFAIAFLIYFAGEKVNHFMKRFHHPTTDENKNFYKPVFLLES